MTWAKLDDGYDEETEALSDRAFRLYTCAVTYSRRRGLAGVLMPKDMASLLRRFKATPRHAAELCEGEPDEALWLRDGDNYIIRSYEKFNPLTSTERVHKHRLVKQSETKRNARETVHETPMKQSETPLARASAPGLETNSTFVPVPVPVVTKASPGDRARETVVHLKDPNDPVLQLQVWWHEFIGRQISEHDKQAAAAFVVEYPRLGLNGIQTRITQHTLWRAENGKTPIGKLEFYRDTLRDQETHLADTGVQRPRESSSAGMQRLGEVLAS